MKKIFNIEIKETISDVFEVEAESSEEAEYLAEEGYYNGENILDGMNQQRRNLSCIDIEGPKYISEERKKEIFINLIDYVSKHTVNEKDYYNALKNIIGLTNNEMTELGIEVTRELTEKTPLKETEIAFEDEVIFNEDEDGINAYIPLHNINIFEKFDLTKRDGFEYNMYLDYYPVENKSIISIIEKDDVNYIVYEYETSMEENEMLRKELEEYIQSEYNQSIAEFINNEENQEEIENGK